MDIDTTGFELGMPTREEMLEHQSHMLCNENDQLRRELAKAKRNIEKLVEINQGCRSRSLPSSAVRTAPTSSMCTS